MKKLAISRIMIEALTLPISDIGKYTRSLVIPVLVMVVIWSIWLLLAPNNSALNLFFYFLYIFAFSYFAVNCHRLVLVDRSPVGIIPYSNFKTISTFTIVFIFIYLLSLIMEWLLLTILLNAFNVADLSKDSIDNLRTLTYIPAMYIVARFSLVFPATAIGHKPNLRWSWRETKGHSLRILIIVAVFPWALTILLSLIQRESATPIEQVILGLLWYTISAIGIFALSLTYRDLKSYATTRL